MYGVTIVFAGAVYRITTTSKLQHLSGCEQIRPPVTCRPWQTGLPCTVRDPGSCTLVCQLVNGGTWTQSSGYFHRLPLRGSRPLKQGGPWGLPA